MCAGSVLHVDGAETENAREVKLKLPVMLEGVQICVEGTWMEGIVGEFRQVGLRTIGGVKCFSGDWAQILINLIEY